MDKKRVRELARIDWQKEKEAKRRARNLDRQSRPKAADPSTPDKEASTETETGRSP